MTDAADGRFRPRHLVIVLLQDETLVHSIERHSTRKTRGRRTRYRDVERRSRVSRRVADTPHVGHRRTGEVRSRQETGVERRHASN